MTLEEAYKVLEINNNSSEEEIKTAYKKLAKKYHPDFYQNNPLAELAEEKLKEINEAYEFLQKESKKNNYSNSSENNKLWKFTYWKDGRLFALNKDFKGYTGPHTEESTIYIKVGNYKNGFKDGVWTVYSTLNKRKLYTENLNEGILEGERVHYFSTKDISIIENYKNGLKHGEEKHFGMLENEQTFLVKKMEWKYGKLLHFIEYSDNEEKIKKYEDNNNFKTKERDIYYTEEGLKCGNGILIYDTGIIEDIFWSKGTLNYFSTKKFKDNEEIKKCFYSMGYTREKKFLRRLNKISFDDIKYIPYINNLKINMTEHEYLFYKNLNYLKSTSLMTLLPFADTGDTYQRIENWYNEITDFMLSKIHEIEFDRGDYNDYECNKDTHINFEIIKEDKPENFIPKFRKRKIEIGMSNILDKIYLDLDKNPNIKSHCEKITTEIIELFINTFYRYSSKEYDFTYGTTLVGGDILNDMYWINLFSTTASNKFIPDNLMLFLNYIFKNTLTGSLINIYFGMLYNFNELIREEIKKITENIENEVWIDTYYFMEDLKKLFKVENLNNILETLDFLLEEDLEEEFIPENLYNLANKCRMLKTIINKKNSIFNIFVKNKKNFNYKIKKFEEEIIKLRELEIENSIKRYEEMVSKLELKNFKIEINKDSNNFKNIKNKTLFLGALDPKTLNENQFKRLSQLKDLYNFTIEKNKIYCNNLNRMEIELEENTKRLEQAKKEKLITMIIFIPGITYFVLKMFGLLFGIGALIGTPIILSSIFSSVQENCQKNIKDLKTLIKQAKNIIDTSDVIISRLKPFYEIFNKTEKDNSKIENEKKESNVENTKSKSKFLRLILIVIFILGLLYFPFKNKIMQYSSGVILEPIPRITNEKILNTDFFETNLQFNEYLPSNFKQISKDNFIRYGIYKKDNEFIESIVYSLSTEIGDYEYYLSCSRDGIISFVVYSYDIDGNGSIIDIPNMENPKEIYQNNKMVTTLSAEQRKVLKNSKKVIKMFKEFSKVNKKEFDFGI